MINPHPRLITKVGRRRRALAVWLGVIMVLALAPRAGVARKIPPPQTFEEWTGQVWRASERLGEQWSVTIQDLETGDVVFAHEPDLRLVPASNRKLLVMGLALDILGPDFRFKTEFGLNQIHPPHKAHYHGDLILRSGGDPSLDPIFMTQPKGPMELLRSWAHTLAQRGIVYVHGDLVLDASAFGNAQNAYPEVWDPMHRTFSYAAVPSTLALGQNLLRVSVRPGAHPGALGRVQLLPSSAGIHVINKTETGHPKRGRKALITAIFNEEGSILEVSGKIAPDGAEAIALAPLMHPLQYFGETMHQALEEQGVQLTGSVVIRTESSTRELAQPLIQRVGSHASPTLARLMRTMTLRSNNFLAEQIWRACAVKAAGRGDRATVRRIEEDWYRRQGLPGIEPGWDGSGLSRRNLNSSTELAAIAKALHQSPHREYLMETLPRSGHNGTLRHRTFSRKGGRVRAKTGTMAGISALTGFIDAQGGGPRYVFSAIGNAPEETDGRLTMRINHLLKIAVRQLDERSTSDSQ